MVFWRCARRAQKVSAAAICSAIAITAAGALDSAGMKCRRFPSGWDEADMRASSDRPISTDPASGITTDSLSQVAVVTLLSDLRAHTRQFEKRIREKAYDEASENCQAIRRCAQMLALKAARAQPPVDSRIFNITLRMDVLAQTIEESRAGDHRARASLYARQLLRLADDLQSQSTRDFLDISRVSASPTAAPP